MSKKWLRPVVGAMVCFGVLVVIGVKEFRQMQEKPLSQLVVELGPPDFLAKNTGIQKRQVKALRVTVLPLDPRSVTNWESITNAVVVWAAGESGKRNARYFYDEMKNDKSFDGGGWYSSRSPFGEKVTVAQVGSTGIATRRETGRVDAIAMKLDGFVPRKADAPSQ